MPTHLRLHYLMRWWRSQDVSDEKMYLISQLLQMHRAELDGHEKQIMEAETWISAIEDMVTLVEAKLQSLEKFVHDMAEHATDLENRGRRKNIRIDGVLECLEGENPTCLFESCLPKTLGIAMKASRIKLERAR